MGVDSSRCARRMPARRPALPGLDGMLVRTVGSELDAVFFGVVAEAAVAHVEKFGGADADAA